MPQRRGTFGTMRQRRASIAIRIIGLAGGFLLLPLPARAHTVGPGAGVEIELLVAGVVILIFGVTRLNSEKTRPWVAWSVIGVGLVLGTLSIVLPRLGAPSRPDATVAIVSPDNGSSVPAGEPVEVKVQLTGGTIAQSATETDKGHLHLYLDGELQQMPYSTSAEVTLQPGVHDLTVEYVDPRHISYDPPILTSIELEAEG
jgi:hypothetical protein